MIRRTRAHTSSSRSGVMRKTTGVPPKNRRKKPDLSSKRGWRWRFLSATHKLHSRRPGAASCARLLGVAVDGASNLFIPDGGRVRKVSPDGIIVTVAGGGPGCD